VETSNFWLTKGRGDSENRKCLYKGSSCLTHFCGIHEVFKGIIFLFTDLLYRAWWTPCLLVISLLFLLLLVCCSMSRYFARVEEAYHTAHSRLKSDLLESDLLESNDLYAPIIRIRRRHMFWSTWATRIFIVTVLSCVGVSLISQYPWAPSPVWLGIVLQIFTYVSAFFFYKTWEKTGEED